MADDVNWYAFPMIFKSVQGECKTSVEESWYNNNEVDEVLRTIKSLLPPDALEYGLRRITETDIGVVTPYRKQRRLLGKQLRRFHFNDIQVGTAETFQGNEKPVIIISTVRSNGTLGFVTDPKVRIQIVVIWNVCFELINHNCMHYSD